MTPPDTENPFRIDGGPRHALVRPKDAASLVLVKHEAGGIRVLMGERAKGHFFLPGRFVFPGGRVDACDWRLAVPTDLRPEVRAKVAAGTTPAKARALGLAAIRETFEDTGVLVGALTASPPRTRAEPWRRFFAEGAVPVLEALDFIARAITPPGRPRRFDARFFMADAGHIAKSLGETRTSGELLKPVWLTLKEAHAADVLPITRVVLKEVEARLTDRPDPARPVPFYIPRAGKAVVRLL